QREAVTGKALLAIHAHKATLAADAQVINRTVTVGFSENSGPFHTVHRCLNQILAGVGVLPLQAYLRNVVDITQINTDPLVITPTAGPAAVGATIDSHFCCEC